jgi:predicted transcriptional regulator
MSSGATVELTVTLPAETKERLERLAVDASTSASDLAVEAIHSFLELRDWQVEGIHEGIREADAGELATEDEVRSVLPKWTGGG